ncbi:bifunctional hydroxymethylpyrimidine kinase/phosphomethylpyrimidine kinase [Streptomyces sp. NBC_00237]|nr:bifunctional hydroxymethylpyrimidine kinase/phosphomethylpyrimidine kinase [Streptomyces sp. NBC_00237]
MHAVPAAFVTEQLHTLFADVPVDAVVAAAVADALERHRPRYVVLAPVMVSTSGHRLLATDAVAVPRDRSQRDDWQTAVRAAQEHLTGALRAADTPRVGSDHGPVHHFHPYWS